MVANCIDITQRCARLWLVILRGFLDALGRCTLGVRRGAFLGCTLLCIPITPLPRFHSVQRYAQLLCDFGASHPLLIRVNALSRVSIYIATTILLHFLSRYLPGLLCCFEEKAPTVCRAGAVSPLTRPLRERFWRSSSFPVPRPGMCPRTGQHLSARTVHDHHRQFHADEQSHGQGEDDCFPQNPQPFPRPPDHQCVCSPLS